MKILVIGGSGLIGSKVVKNLQAKGHEAVSASPASGVNTITGEGLAAAMKGMNVVVDVSNSPSFADAEVMAFFQTSTRNLLSAEKTAGVNHHVALSVVGCDRIPDSGYMRAKAAQEMEIKVGSIPFSILRATQFFEFIGRIVDSSTKDRMVRVSPAKMQPVAADDVAAALTEVTLGKPLGGMVELGGPELIGLDELARRSLRFKRDGREVIPDPHARYFGTELDDRTLNPGASPRLGTIRFDHWLQTSVS